MNNRLLTGGGEKDALLRHFIQRDFPKGLTLIDHTGKLAEAIADSIPKEHSEDVLYFDPSDATNIASFNVFERVATHERAKLVDDLCAFFDALFPAGEDTLTKQSSKFVLSNILTILLDTKDVSFLSVLDFITDSKFRDACIERCTNPVALLNWDAIANWERSQKKAAFAQVEIKVGTLLLSPVMYRTLQNMPGTFYLTKERIFIANLSRERIGDAAANALGTLLISRASTPVYINDFGFFASDHLASLFSKGGYTVALQFLSELPKSVQQTVLGFEEKYVYRTTLEDAEKLRFYLGIQNPAVLVDLSEDEFLPRVPLDPPLATRRLKAIRKRSDTCHTRRSERPASAKSSPVSGPSADHTSW